MTRSTLVPKIMCAAGLLLIALAAFSMSHYRAAGVLETRPLPLDALLKCFVGFAIAGSGALFMWTDFKQIKASVDLAQKSWDSLAFTEDSAVLNHRGAAIQRALQQNRAAAGKR